MLVAEVLSSKQVDEVMRKENERLQEPKTSKNSQRRTVERGIKRDKRYLFSSIKQQLFNSLLSNQSTLLPTYISILITVSK